MLSGLKVGIALGSGGARGWAHIGVLRRLMELGIEPVCMAGTSIGSIITAVYATRRMEEAAALSKRLDWRQVVRLFFEVGIPHGGLVGGKRVVELLQEIIPVKTFEELPLPCAAVATDLDTEKAVVLNQGSLIDAIRASISIPGVFAPKTLNGRVLLDGGLVNPLPVDVCRDMGAEFVIGIDVNLREMVRKPESKVKPTEPSPEILAWVDRLGNFSPQLKDSLSSLVKRLSSSLHHDPESEDELSLFDILLRSFRLTENQITRWRLETNPPDFLIQPAVAQIKTLDFHHGEEAIRAGEEAVDEVLPKLLPLITPKTEFIESPCPFQMWGKGGMRKKR